MVENKKHQWRSGRCETSPNRINSAVYLLLSSHESRLAAHHITGTRSAASQHRESQNVVRSITLRFVLTRISKSNSHLEVIERTKFCAARWCAAADPVAHNTTLVLFQWGPNSAAVQSLSFRTNRFCPLVTNSWKVYAAACLTCQHAIFRWHFD
jgi:hypothetical protein